MVFCDGTDAFYLFILLWHHRLYAGNDAHRRRAFYKTCYTDQGYLTHTLPVTPHQLLNSKILTAIFTHLLMIFAIILSIFIILQVGIHHVFSFIPDYSYAELRHEFSIVFADILDSFEGRIWPPPWLIYRLPFILLYRWRHLQCHHAVWLCIAGTALCKTPHCRCDCRILSLAVCHDDHRIYHSHSYVHPECSREPTMTMPPSLASCRRP